jgi:hypothetical protein
VSSCLVKSLDVLLLILGCGMMSCTEGLRGLQVPKSAPFQADARVSDFSQHELAAFHGRPVGSRPGSSLREGRRGPARQRGLSRGGCVDYARLNLCCNYHKTTSCHPPARQSWGLKP